ncbi:MAG TPA: beta-ketoacyl-ACP synthase III [Acidimicrobiia bacterium]|nr:beta-ketoacyl-ACP synthase III [Acidimicrobiia bacterium]
MTAPPKAGPVRAAIAGWGLALPEGRLTNADLEARDIGTSDQWILERTGIRERRMCAPDETTAGLAIAAGNAAIKSAGITPGDLSMVIVATCTPEQPLPETSSFVADGLGVRCGAFDVGAACAGFSYGLVVAAGLVATGANGPILLIGAENLTRIVDPAERGTVILFGDGAGAAVIGPSAGGDGGPGLLSWDMGSDGSAAHLIEVTAGGSRQPTTAETVAAGDHWMKMDGPEVFRKAVRVVVESSNAALAKAGLTADQVDWFLPHQANARIVSAASSRLKIGAERCIVNIDRFGNTSAASIPIALAEAADDGRLKDGDIVLTCGFGAGMTWSSSVLRWGRPVAGQ